MSFAIRVFGKDGDDYLCDGLGDTPTMFPSRAEAQAFAKFMEQGADAGDRVDVVPYPREAVFTRKPRCHREAR